MALLTCALGTGAVKSIGVRGPPWIVIGRQPPSASNRAPMRVSGSMTRFIGRRLSDASPTMVLAKGCAARMPDISRVVVPELPASSGPWGACSPRRPRPTIVTVRAHGVSLPPGPIVMATPIVRKQASVDWQSAPGE